MDGFAGGLAFHGYASLRWLDCDPDHATNTMRENVVTLSKQKRPALEPTKMTGPPPASANESVLPALKAKAGN
jgi:hypothetical protein